MKYLKCMTTSLLLLVTACGGGSTSDINTDSMNQENASNNIDSDSGEINLSFDDAVFGTQPGEQLMRSPEPTAPPILYLNEYQAFNENRFDMRSEFQFTNVQNGFLETDVLNINTTLIDSDTPVLRSASISSSVNGININGDMQFDSLTGRLTEIVYQSPNAWTEDRGESFVKIAIDYSIDTDAVSFCYENYYGLTMGSVRFTTDGLKVLSQSADGYCIDVNNADSIESEEIETVTVNQLINMLTPNIGDAASLTRSRRDSDFESEQIGDLDGVVRSVGQRFSAALVPTGMAGAGILLVIEGIGAASAAPVLGLAFVGLGAYLIYEAINSSTVGNADKVSDAINAGNFTFDDTIYCNKNGNMAPCTVGLL